MFDLFVLPILRRQSQEQAEMPGLYAVQSPRRPARGRDQDRLLLYLTLTGNAPLPDDQTFLLLERAGEDYYRAAGAVTSAMLAAARSVNEFLSQRNFRNTNTGRQAIGLLTLAVLRGDTLYLGHCGPVHSYVLGDGRLRHFVDAPGSGRGLGLTRQASVRYFQATLFNGSYVLLTHQPPAAWSSEALQFPAGSTLEQVRRTLISAPDADLSGVVSHVQTGSGKVHLLRVKNSLQNMAQGLGGEMAARPQDVAPTPTPAPTNAPTRTSAPAPQPAPPPAAQTAPPSPPTNAPTPAAAATPSSPARTTPTAHTPSPTNAPPTPTPPAGTRPSARPPIRSTPANPGAPPAWRAALKKFVASALQLLRTFYRAWKNTWQAFGQFLRKLLPDESMFDISPATLTFLTVALPLLVALLGAAMYLERGQEAQYNQYYQQAVQAAAEVPAEADPSTRRAGLNRVLQLVETARRFRDTPEAQLLFWETRGVLDQMDAIVRLDFQPTIIGGLDSRVRITRMTAAAGDLYLLDSSSGEVLRAVQTGGGYQMDPSFSCGPTPAPIVVEKLIDLVALPRPTSFGSALVAMDAFGTLLFCIPGGEAVVQSVAPPGTGFVSPRAFEYNNGDLYVLDTGSNAVWIYRGMDFSAQPRPFFTGDPPAVQDVVDLAVNGEDLYLLHADGRQTRCTYSALIGAPTNCQSPFVYADRRPGRQDGPVIAEAVFDQIYFARPPDPSLYLLDAPNQAIYHFGMQLSLQRQYRPLQPLPANKATAFALSPERLMFLALGHDVYYAALP